MDIEAIPAVRKLLDRSMKLASIAVCFPIWHPAVPFKQMHFCDDQHIGRCRKIKSKFSAGVKYYRLIGNMHVHIANSDDRLADLKILHFYNYSFRAMNKMTENRSQEELYKLLLPTETEPAVPC